jgi:putative MATE family efflux protein
MSKRPKPFFLTLNEDAPLLRLFVGLTVPISLQSLLVSLVNMVDTIMIGQIGSLEISAVGLVNQIYFVLSLIIVGTASGATIFISQYYGKDDKSMVRTVASLAFVVIGCACAVFSFLGLACPEEVLGLFSRDESVIRIGSDYFRIVAWSYIPTGFSLGCTMVFRNLGKTKIPLASTCAALAVKILMNYALIFGRFGAPRLGVRGVAFATLSVRILEACVMAYFLYVRHGEYAPRPRDLLGAKPEFVAYALRVSLPVIINETVWSMGFMMYNVVFYHMGYKVGAAVNIAKVLEELILSFLRGAGHAGAIILGRMLGAGKACEVPYCARRLAAYDAVVGGIIGICMALGSGPFASIYHVDDAVRVSAIIVMRYMALFMPFRGINCLHVMGTLRVSGDTVGAMVIDNVTVWCFALPLAFVTGYLLSLPITVVYFCIVMDDFVKFFLIRWRLRGDRWARSLV